MRQKWLLALLIVVAIGAIVFKFTMSLREEPRQPVGASPQLLAEVQAILEAEKIADPYERCLAYPDFASVRWDRSIVEAYCGLLLRKAMSLQEIDAVLRRGDTDQLGQTFDGYLRKNYEKGQHGFLTWEFDRAFDNSDSFDVADRWVKADPDSAFALTARGIAYLNRAWRARGGDFVSKTPRENFERVHELGDQSLSDLKEAARRSPRLISAYTEMLNLAQLTSDDELFSHALHRALALDPADQRTYNDWADAVEPKWGGSIAEMEDVATRAMRHADENPLLKRMPARPLCAQGNMVEICKSCGSPVDRAKKALTYYQDAANIGPSNCSINEGAEAAERAGDNEATVRFYSQAFRFGDGLNSVYRRAIALQRLGHHDLALESLDVAVREQPRYPMTYVYQGWVDQENHQPHEAEKAFLAATAIDRDNREANTELVMLYTTALNEFDKGKAIVDRMMSENPNNPRAWLLSAVLDHGKDDKHCKMALEKYLALVDRNNIDSYEQRDIDRATARVKELASQIQKTEASTTVTK